MPLTPHQTAEATAAMRTVAALFVRRDSIYKTLPGVECYDVDRDASLFSGGMPVVAHPPCRAWGRFRHLAKPEPGELKAAMRAVLLVRRFGGVLEHPASSTLWNACGMRRPGEPRDSHGGYTIEIEQHDFGHKCRKRTWLYIVGVYPQKLPAWSIDLAEPTYCIDTMKRGPHKPRVSHADRERTPLEFAKWLVEIARRTKVPSCL